MLLFVIRFIREGPSGQEEHAAVCTPDCSLQLGEAGLLLLWSSYTQRC